MPSLLSNFVTPVDAIRLPLCNIVDAINAIVGKVIAMILAVLDFVVAAVGNRILPVVAPIGTVLRSRPITRPPTFARSLTGLWRAVLQKVRSSVARTITRSRRSSARFGQIQKIIQLPL